MADAPTLPTVNQPAADPVDSEPELLTLHAVRLKGMADAAEVAARFALDPQTTAELLLDFQAYGWVSYADFAGTAGWSLTASGRERNHAQLVKELSASGAETVVRAAYDTFLARNHELLRAVTDWQLRPSATDPLAANDHADGAWDADVLDRLRTLGAALPAVVQAPASRLSRFAGYDVRFATALARAGNGDYDWVTRPRIDSCHTVWMELHEDLLATLGLERGAEPDR
jgi:hypothetical protein